MSQSLSDTLQPEATYTLSLFVGNPRAYFSPVCRCFFNLEGFPSYRVELLAGGVVLAADDNTLLPAEGTFQRTSIIFTGVRSDDPLVGEPLSIRLVNFNDIPGREVDFDDVQLTVADACPWDLDGDGEVGITDFLALLADWGNPYGIEEFLALLADWGPCP